MPGAPTAVTHLQRRHRQAGVGANVAENLWCVSGFLPDSLVRWSARGRGYARSTSWFAASSCSINSIIGAGIFLTPGEVIGLAGPFMPMGSAF